MAFSPAPLRVAVLGFGAIGRTVASALSQGAVKNARLTGIVTRRPQTVDVEAFQVFSLDEALECSDLVVECASVGAVQSEGLRIINAGVDLLVSSVGALVDDTFRARLRPDDMTDHMARGLGRCLVTSGAMGGLDVLGAAARDGGLSEASLTTTKAPVAVAQSWMTESEREALESATEPVTVFRGNVREAITLFPKSLNVAVALALTTNLWEKLTVTMVADPGATLTTHAVKASGTSGDYDFTMRHRPHPDNPATSGVVPEALLQEIEWRALGLR